MPTVLHLTAHMGGGVGRALSAVACFARRQGSRFHHRILMLEEPEKKQFIDECRNCGVVVTVGGHERAIESEMSTADVVVLNWWHHPLVAALLASFPQVPVRLVLWSHVNGCSYPALPYSFASRAHKTIFTTPYSLENPYWTDQQRLDMKRRASVVYGMGDLDARTCTPPVRQARSQDSLEHRFTIGYVGTLAYGKLHPEFIDFCVAVVERIPEAYFVMVGDTENVPGLLERAAGAGIAERFEFVGYTDDVSRELARFDVFGYPLDPGHFGTTENALLEALAAGVPVVCLNQGAEKHLVDHGVHGYLADGRDEYGDFIKRLHDHPEERLRMGHEAGVSVHDRFSVAKNIASLHDTLEQVIRLPSYVLTFGDVFGQRPFQWFLACLGEERAVFEASTQSASMDDPEARTRIESSIATCRAVLRGRSKSSVLQFSRYFPEDPFLLYWRDLVSGVQPVQIGPGGHS